MSNRIYIFIVFWLAVMPAPLFAKAEGSASKQEQERSFLPAVALPDYVYDDGQKRDPFIPLVTSDGRFVQLERAQEDEGSFELKLEGIIYDKYGLSYAIVDSSVVKIGDVIGDYQVLKIEEDRVVFIKEGQIKEVLLQKEE
jgi:hypothetical protein